MPQNLQSYLQANAYPGRGILLGRSLHGTHAFIAYFIMGRSENSRNRVFVEQDGGIVTQAADPARVQDPSLILYTPVARMGEHTVVTNGDQTDTICKALAAGSSFEAALRKRTFEPDAPNHTPRISGMLTLGWGGFTYTLSILKSADGDAASVQRQFFEYPQPMPGVGHLLHTYAQNGDPLPSFAGEPVAVALPFETLAQFGETVWQALNTDNKISLFVRSIALDGAQETLLYNRYQSV